MNSLGPDFGYFPNNKKRRIIAKPNKKETVKEVFKETAVNIKVKEKIHLGMAISSREYQEEYINKKVYDWASEVVQLPKFAQTQPQAHYAAFTFGFRHRWTYSLRTRIY